MPSIAALAIKTQVQFDHVARAYQLLELEHFHAGKRRRQVEQLLAQVERPFHLHHTRQYRRVREMPAEVGQVRGDAQLQGPFAVSLDLRQHLRGLGARRQEQGVDLRLGQFALGVERQLPQQAPATGQGQRFRRPGPAVNYPATCPTAGLGVSLKGCIGLGL